jgi:hypothetical protein
LVVEYFSICAAVFLSIWKIILVNWEFVAMSFVSTFSHLAGRSALLIGSGPCAVAAPGCLVDADVRVRGLSRNVRCAEDIVLAGEPGQVELMFRAPRALDFEEALPDVENEILLQRNHDTTPPRSRSLFRSLGTGRRSTVRALRCSLATRYRVPSESRR